VITTQSSEFQYSQLNLQTTICTLQEYLKLVPERLRQYTSALLQQLYTDSTADDLPLLTPLQCRDLCLQLERTRTAALLATLQHASSALHSAERETTPPDNMYESFLEEVAAERSRSEQQQQFEEHRRPTAAERETAQEESMYERSQEAAHGRAVTVRYSASELQQQLEAELAIARQAHAVELELAGMRQARAAQLQAHAVAAQRTDSHSQLQQEEVLALRAAVSNAFSLCDGVRACIESSANRNTCSSCSAGARACGSGTADAVSMSAAALGQLSLSALNQRETALEAALAAVHTAQRAAQSSEAEQRSLCCVCQDAKKTVLLLPCRHLCLCSGCCTRLRSSGGLCPICRVLITDSLDVYT
jgi:DNA segregation ATPase FtsK/SpoIIIE-like protein